MDAARDDVIARDEIAEADFLGTWFARLGALACLIAAGFAFRYGVEAGVIGPELRVGLGLLVGTCLLAIGHMSHRRGWEGLATATSAGGLATVYLSVLAAHFLYDLIGGTAAVAVLTGVAVLNGALALYYDSVVLATLATLGGLFNAYMLRASGDAEIVLGYVALVAAAAVAASTARGWRTPSLVAWTGTLIAYGAHGEDLAPMVAVGMIAIFWALFASAPLARSWGEESSTFVVTTTSLAFIALQAAVTPEYEELRGAVTLMLGVGHATLAALSYAVRRDLRHLYVTHLGLAGILTVLFVPLQFDGAAVHAVWAVQGAGFAWIGARLDDRPMILRGAMVSLLGLAALTAHLQVDYQPAAPYLSGEGLAVGVHVGALYALGRIWASRGDTHELRIAPYLMANLVTVAWASVEAATYFRSPLGYTETLQFALSGIWSVYAAGLLAVGIGYGIRWARLSGVALLAVTIAKVVVVDLWLLDLGLRTLAFATLGAMLLLCSFMYSRFKDVIVGSFIGEAEADARS